MSKILDEMKARYGSRKTIPRRPSPARPAPARAKRKFSIEADTSIMPDVMAEAVCERAARLLDIPAVDERLIEYLVDHARHIYSINPDFRKKVRSEADNGNAGRNYLHAFMCHWLASELVRKGASRRLLVDSGFSMGHPASLS